jgi:hypothetical protein
MVDQFIKILNSLSLGNLEENDIFPSCISFSDQEKRYIEFKLACDLFNKDQKNIKRGLSVFLVENKNLNKDFYLVQFVKHNKPLSSMITP